MRLGQIVKDSSRNQPQTLCDEANGIQHASGSYGQQQQQIPRAHSLEEETL